MPQTTKIEVFLGQKPDGPVEDGQTVTGSVTPPQPPSSEVAGRSWRYLYLKCWKCSGVFHALDDDSYRIHRCPYCGAENIT